VAALSWSNPATLTLPFARYASIRTLSSELTLFGGSVHRMRSVFSGSIEVLQSSERSLLLEGKPSPYSAVTLEIRSAIRQEEPWPSTTLFRIVAAAVPVVFTSSLYRYPAPSQLLFR
jgi:hypothetical protein